MTHSVAVIGCGNIGTAAALLIAREPGVSRLTLVDPDEFEHRNLQSQSIGVRDVGRTKVDALADRVREARPGMDVFSVPSRVERAPLGLLRASVILGCLDTRIARQHVNEMAWRLGVPVVDAGVDGSLLLARIDTLVPGVTRCAECAWGAADYAALEIPYACRDEETRPSNSPSYLGALAASLQVCEAVKIMSGDVAQPGARVLIGMGNHTHSLTAYNINPECRFDHETWSIELLEMSPGATLRELLVRIGDVEATGSLGVAGTDFVTHHLCPSCGCSREETILSRCAGSRTCGACEGVELISTGMHTHTTLPFSALLEAWGHRHLSDVGLMSHDVITVRLSGTTRHFELRGISNERPDLA